MAITCDRVKEATASDNNMEKLLSIIATGFPHSVTNSPVIYKNTINSVTTCTQSMGLSCTKNAL
jgi:hypothetical protein